MSIRYRDEVTTREHIQATQDFLSHLSLESNRHCTNYKRSFSERPDDDSFVWSRDDARGGRKLQRFSSYPLQACTTQIRFTREIAKEDCSSRFVFVPNSNTVLAVFSVLPYKPRESSGTTARGRGIFQRESSCTSGYSHTISYAELLDHPADEYDPHWLEDGVSAVNPNRTEIALPGTLISFLEFENPESYKKDTNERFKEKWPEVEITLSKMKSIKKELHKVSVSLRLPVSDASKQQNSLFRSRDWLSANQGPVEVPENYSFYTCVCYVCYVQLLMSVVGEDGTHLLLSLDSNTHYNVRCEGVTVSPIAGTNITLSGFPLNRPISFASLDSQARVSVWCEEGEALKPDQVIEYGRKEGLDMGTVDGRDCGSALLLVTKTSSGRDFRLIRKTVWKVWDTSTGSSAVVARPWFELYRGLDRAVRISRDWTECVKDVVQDGTCRVAVCGPKNSGKSTLCKYIVNQILSTHGPVLYIETDLGQPEICPPGHISLTLLREPLLGPPCTNQPLLSSPLSTTSPHLTTMCCGVGKVSPAEVLDEYMVQLEGLISHARGLSLPIVLNNMGWTKGFGVALHSDIFAALDATHVVNLVTNSNKDLPPIEEVLVTPGIKGRVADNPSLPLIANLPAHPATKQSTGLQAHELRHLHLLQYFSPIYGGGEIDPPYRVRWDDIRVETPEDLGSDMVPYLLNLSIVDLIGQGGACLGMAVVRSVDVQNNLYYLNTPVPAEVLENQVTGIRHTSLPIPHLPNNGNLPAPYLSNLAAQEIKGLAEYDTDRETMMEKLENFKGAADEQQSSQWQITQKEEELSALQKAISDLQVCLFQEREQLAEYDTDRETMMEKLENFKGAADEQQSSQWQITQKEEELSALQKAISDLQVCLFQEREQVLKVHAENDRLKIRELEDRQKIQHLLSLNSGPTSQHSTTYFVTNPPIKSKFKSRNTKKEENERKEPKLLTDAMEKNSLLLTIDSLQAQLLLISFTKPCSCNPHLITPPPPLQLHDSKKVYEEQIAVLREDMETRAAEHEVSTRQLGDRVEHLSDQLRKSQGLLYDSTKDFLTLKYEHRQAERRWIEEKDHLLRELDKLKQDLDTTCEELTVVGEQALLGLTGKEVIVTSNKNLQVELEQANKLCDMYREQCLTLEEELCRLKEENDVSRSLFKERTSQMSKRLTTMNSRYEALESRRNLEIEGFKTDVQMLRKRVQELEKQLIRVIKGVQRKVYQGSLYMARDSQDGNSSHRVTRNRNRYFPDENSKFIIQSDPDLPGPDLPDPRFTGRVNFPQNRKFTVFDPDITGTSIYRAKPFPPSIPVNRGPTVLAHPLGAPYILRGVHKPPGFAGWPSLFPHLMVAMATKSVNMVTELLYYVPK
eukprot:sb/3461001/